jgi:predicted permease
MELRFSLRSLWKSPGFTALAVIVLALGIGANTAIFSVVNAVLLRPLQYRDPDRIVTVRPLYNYVRTSTLLTGPDFHDLQNQNSIFSSMGYYIDDQSTVITGSSAEYRRIAMVTPSFFDVMGAAAAEGRLFSEPDSKNDPAIAVVSEAFWRNHFGGQPVESGQSITAAAKALRIVGVMPEGFGFPNHTDVWIPSWTYPENPERSAGFCHGVARLKSGVTLEQAQAQLSGIAKRLEKAYPGSNRGKGVILTPLRNDLVAHVRLTLYVLLGAVGLVLLIACANVANLLLARATSRAREIAIRTALGSSRARIAGQMFIEGIVLALLAGGAGLLIANWGLAVLIAFAPKDVPRLDSVAIDGGVLAFTLGASLLASILFGLAPAWQASRTDPNDALRQGGSRGIFGGASGRVRNILVVAEIALSVVLVVAAGLLIRSFSALNDVDLGFHPERLVTAEFNIPAQNQEQTQAVQRQFFVPLLQQLSSTPGVISAAAVLGLPDSTGFHSNGSYIVQGQTMADFTVSSPQAGFTSASGSYFATMGIPIIQGRAFNERDTENAPSVAIISESLARQSFPQQNPIGRTITCGWTERSMKGMTIVGVAGDVRNSNPTEKPGPEIYMPYLQNPQSNLIFVVRTAGDPASMIQTIRQTAHNLDPQAAMRATTMQSTISESIASQRFRSMLLSIFASLAVCLAMAGIYGVMAYSVTQRTAEVGLRMALGAEPRDIAKLVLGQVMRLTTIGLAAGVVGAVIATRLLRSMLFEVKPGDPATYIGMICLIAAIALLAGYLPARRAARIEPLEALREE